MTLATMNNVERVYRLMFAKVGNRPDAEDLTTEVFLAALRPLRVSASVGEVRAYLLATARTVLAAHWRRGWIRAARGPGDAAHVPPTITKVWLSERRPRRCWSRRCPTSRTRAPTAAA